MLATHLKFIVAKLLIFERKAFFEFYSIVLYFEDSEFSSIFRCTYCSHIIEISCKRAKFRRAFCSTDIRCPFLCWTILIWPSSPVSVHTQDMSVFISIDRVFCLYPQLSNFSRFEINTVLPKSNDSEVLALFP